VTTSSYLVRPTPVYRGTYLAALREGLGHSGEPQQTGDEIAAIAADFDAPLGSLDKDVAVTARASLPQHCRFAGHRH
jgi:hypothetical protein